MKVSFKGIEGQEKALAILKSQLEAGKAPHAYIFVGPEGTGRKKTAFELAKAVNCAGAAEVPCGECVSCGKKAAISDLTYDHVVPRSQGGLTEWTNIVTCCYLCNRKKGGRTPQEAGMRLLVHPTQPNWVPAVAIRISLRSVPDAWRDYLYWTGELDTSGDPGG